MEGGQGKERGEEATDSAENESVHQQLYRDQQYAVTPVEKKRKIVSEIQSMLQGC